jgi:hypothetical protein
MSIRMLKAHIGWPEAKAENLKVTSYTANSFAVDFEFACPNCGCRHHWQEISRSPFDRVGRALSCGRVQVNLNLVCQKQES